MAPLEIIGLVLLGFSVGVFGTLVGAGGGFILTPVLLLVDPQDSPATITSISLAVVFLNALSGSIAYARLGRTDYRSGVPFALATVPGAVLGALVVAVVPRRLFSAITAVLLAGLATWLLARKAITPRTNPEAGATVRSFKDRAGVTYTYSFRMTRGVVYAAGVGFVSSFVGLGGGIMHVPLLVQALGFPVHVATATSHFVLVFTSASGTVTHLLSGGFSARGGLIALVLGVGVVAGAQAGAWLSRRTSGPVIQRLLAVALILLSVRLLASVM